MSEQNPFPTFQEEDTLDMSDIENIFGGSAEESDDPVFFPDTQSGNDTEAAQANAPSDTEGPDTTPPADTTPPEPVPEPAVEKEPDAKMEPNAEPPKPAPKPGRKSARSGKASTASAKTGPSAKAEVKVETPVADAAKSDSKAADADSLQSLFDAFADPGEDVPPAPVPETQGGQNTSLFDKPPVFSYGGAKDPIPDASLTFEELRIQKADDFPELEEGKTVSWRVKYGTVTKPIPNPKDATVGGIKEEIERSKAFLDGLRKGKDKSPDCLVTPSVTAKSKGIAAYKGFFPTVEAAQSSDKVICLIPSRSGQIFELRKTEAGNITAPKQKIVDFAEVRAGFVPALPPIPRTLMGRIIAFFRALMEENAEYEALVYLYWDRQEREFVPFVPKQKATKVNVFTQIPGNCLPEERYLHYADIHSHNSMAAKFSAVDDRDEKASRLYIVLGNLDRFYPSISVRVSCGGTFVPLEPYTVLESVEESFPTEWLEQVETVAMARHQETGGASHTARLSAAVSGLPADGWEGLL